MNAKGENNNYSLIRDKIVKGDEKALAALYFEIFDPLLNYGLKYTSNKETVEDCIQDLFVDLLNNRQKLATVNNLRFYLFKSIKYLVIKELKKNQKLDSDTDVTNLPFLISYSIEKSIIKKEQAENRQYMLLETLKKLSNKEKEAVYLKFNCGFGYQEISESLEISIESARTLIYRAIKRIRDTLGSKKTSGLYLFLFHRELAKSFL